MRCIYFNGTNCLAVPPASGLSYKPTDEDKKDYCESGAFQDCPRLKAFAEYLQAVNAGKQK